VNWPADLARQAVGAAAGLGVVPPCAVQLPYSLVQRSWVEDAAMTRALDAAGAGDGIPAGQPGRHQRAVRATSAQQVHANCAATRAC
jgi:hypothetical protein